MLKRGKKLAMIGMAVLMAASVFTGCGNSSGKTSDGKVEISWMASTQPQEKVIYQKIIKKFEQKYPNVKIKFITADSDTYNQKLTAAASSNTLPDVYYVGSGDVRKWADNNQLLDIQKYVDQSKLDDMWTSALDSYRYNGKEIGKGDLYALPRSTGPFIMAYNKTMFEKAGIPLPDPKKPYTWDQFVQIAKQLTKDTNGDGKMDQFGTGLAAQFSLQSFVWSNGGDWLDDTHKKVTVDTPEFIEALQYFVDMQNKYKITPSISETQSLGGYQRWLKGQMAFYAAATWDISTFNKSLPFDYGLMTPPVSPKTNKPATWVQSVGFGISAKTKHPKEAVQFITYLSADKEGNKEEAAEDLQMPNVKSVADSDYFSKAKPVNISEFKNAVENYGRRMPAEYTYTSAWYDEFFTNIQPVLDGKVSPSEYCKKEQPKMQKLLDDSYKQQQAAKKK